MSSTSNSALNKQIYFRRHLGRQKKRETGKHMGSPRSWRETSAKKGKLAREAKPDSALRKAKWTLKEEIKEGGISLYDYLCVLLAQTRRDSVDVPLLMEIYHRNRRSCSYQTRTKTEEL